MGRKRIYDELRGAFVCATPEELVRQNLLQKMVRVLGYPKELISIERSLQDLCSSKRGVPVRRVDIACFVKKQGDLLPLVLIECKESEHLARAALEQVKGYNFFFQSPFIAVAHEGGEIFGYPSDKGTSYLSYLPPYAKLLEALSCKGYL